MFHKCIDFHLAEESIRAVPTYVVLSCNFTKREELHIAKDFHLMEKNCNHNNARKCTYNACLAKLFQLQMSNTDHFGNSSFSSSSKNAAAVSITALQRKHERRRTKIPSERGASILRKTKKLENEGENSQKKKRTEEKQGMAEEEEHKTRRRLCSRGEPKK